jgi:hypothetical protein
MKAGNGDFIGLLPAAVEARAAEVVGLAVEIVS